MDTNALPAPTGTRDPLQQAEKEVSLEEFVRLHNRDPSTSDEPLDPEEQPLDKRLVALFMLVVLLFGFVS